RSWSLTLQTYPARLHCAGQHASFRPPRLRLAGHLRRRGQVFGALGSVLRHLLSLRFLTLRFENLLHFLLRSQKIWVRTGNLSVLPEDSGSVDVMNDRGVELGDLPCEPDHAFDVPQAHHALGLGQSRDILDPQLLPL